MVFLKKREIPYKKIKSQVQALFFFVFVYNPWSEWSEKNSESPAVAGASHRPTFVGRRGFFSDLFTSSVIPKKNKAQNKDLKTIFNFKSEGFEIENSFYWRVKEYEYFDNVFVYF